MKVKVFVFCFIFAVFSASVFADTPSADQKAAMDAMMKMGAPGEQHKWLATFEGKWNINVKSWMDPSKPPETSTGTCESKMVMGGRFLHQECTGSMMGMPFNGMGITGYDNQKKKYIGTWMDNFGTQIMWSEGTETEPGKAITMTSQMEDPMMGPMQIREVLRVTNPNQYVFEMYGTAKEGKEAKMMEITYTRTK